MFPILVLWENLNDFEVTEEVFLIKNAPEYIKEKKLKEGGFFIYNRLEEKAKMFIFYHKEGKLYIERKMEK